MSTLRALRRAVHRIQDRHILKAKTCRFLCGMSQRSLRAFTSVDAAGRCVSKNRWNGESRMRQIVTDQGFTEPTPPARRSLHRPRAIGSQPIRPILHCRTALIGIFARL